MSILIAVVSGFASGVGVRSLFYFGWPVVVFVLILAALLGAAAFYKPRLAYTLGMIFCLFVAFGMMRSAAADTPAPEAFMRDLRHRVQYEGVVVADPDVREKNQRIALKVRSGEATAGMLAVMPLSADVRVGDRVRVYGKISLPQAFETENGRTFRYDKYLEARGIRFLIQYGSIYMSEPAPWYSVPAALARVKHSFLDGLDRALPMPDSALAGGIVIGGKEGLGAELKDAFTRSGLVQIIVLSGYNVMIVAEWVMAFFALLALPRRIQFFAGGAALLLFVGIAGISATAVRAAIMAVIALYARATGRSYAASRALLFAVLLMLVWNPLYLVFDPGFGLSVAATAGIIWLAPIFERMMDFVSPSSDGGLTKSLYDFWKNVVATTLAAQISVLPLLLYNIGLFSLVALPANLVVNPLVPLAMAGAAIAGVIGMTIGSFIPVVATIVGYPVFIFMRYFIFIAEKSSALPYAAFDLPLFSFWLVLIAYAVLIYFASSKRLSTTDQFKFAKKASI
ncbi:MAG: ComEC/Rec2 family competence protein [bacterium]|nr:ComEC/Rec2 family competence protein [bacterium]